jgi:hypothetical protein
LTENRQAFDQPSGKDRYRIWTTLQPELFGRRSFVPDFPGGRAMAVNKPTGDNARKGAVRKRSQLETKAMGEKHWTKRSKASGQFMDQKDKGKFKGVRKER